MGHALRELRQRYRAHLSQHRSPLILTLVDQLFTGPALTANQAGVVPSVPRFTAQWLVDDLVLVGIVEEIAGRQRNRAYVANEILQLLEHSR